MGALRFGTVVLAVVLLLVWTTERAVPAPPVAVHAPCAAGTVRLMDNHACHGWRGPLDGRTQAVPGTQEGHASGGVLRASGGVLRDRVDGFDAGVNVSDCA